MNLVEALQSAKEGNFVTNEYFDYTQSLHFYKGKFYYEDGAVVTSDFLFSQTFAREGAWCIAIGKEDINFEKLADMHEKSNGYMLDKGSYMDCMYKASERR